MKNQKKFFLNVNSKEFALSNEKQIKVKYIAASF